MMICSIGILYITKIFENEKYIVNLHIIINERALSKIMQLAQSAGHSHSAFSYSLFTLVVMVIGCKLPL